MGVTRDKLNIPICIYWYLEAPRANRVVSVLGNMPVEGRTQVLSAPASPVACPSSCECQPVNHRKTARNNTVVLSYFDYLRLSVIAGISESFGFITSHPVPSEGVSSAAACRWLLCCSSSTDHPENVLCKQAEKHSRYGSHRSFVSRGLWPGQLRILLY